VIRVGFPPIGGQAWQGGRNYLWNLLHATSLIEQRQIQPVLMSRPGAVDDLLVDGVERFERDGFFASPRAVRAGSLLRYLVGRDLVEEHWLARARIDVLSHGGPLGRSRVPWIFWVPDLQHRHFPEFFGRLEGRLRDRIYRDALADAAIVVTSSAAARDDLVRFYGAGAARLRVLHFVSSPRVELSQLPSKAQLMSKLGVPARYFHLPNQFWKHKNHAVVVEALAAAPEVTVVATGGKEDYRNPDHYRQLMARVDALGLGERFRHLGMVSYDELIALMRHSAAVLNPSLFEGWSSTVEEAKSLGKRVLVSDIAVHREQAPARGQFFGAHDSAALAALLREAWGAGDEAEEERAVAEAARALPGRMRAFGQAYQELVVEAARRRR
jgi:glycosyltransferase involved in cell wall biosynthesis